MQPPHSQSIVVKYKIETNAVCLGALCSMAADATLIVVVVCVVCIVYASCFCVVTAVARCLRHQKLLLL